MLAAGVALHRPLARVPENTIKFAVGLLLSTFGTFWAVEGLGLVRRRRRRACDWPGGDAGAAVLLAAVVRAGLGDGPAAARRGAAAEVA